MKNFIKKHGEKLEPIAWVLLVIGSFSTSSAFNTLIIIGIISAFINNWLLNGHH